MKEETVERLRAIMSDTRGQARVYRQGAKDREDRLLLDLSDSFCLDANAILEALEALGARGLPEKLVLEEVAWRTK